MKQILSACVLDEEFKSKLKDVKGKIPSDLTHKFPGSHDQVRGVVCNI